MQNIEMMLKEISENTEKLYNLLSNYSDVLEKRSQCFFDYSVETRKEQRELTTELQKLRNIVDQQNARIFALEFYKEKLSQK